MSRSMCSDTSRHGDGRRWRVAGYASSPSDKWLQQEMATNMQAESQQIIKIYKHIFKLEKRGEL